MKRKRDLSSEDKGPFPFGELIEDMRHLVRTFLDPVARFRLRCTSRFCHQEDARFTLPERLRLPSSLSKDSPGYSEFLPWGLAWMEAFETPIFRWISTTILKTTCSLFHQTLEWTENDAVLLRYLIPRRVAHGIQLSLATDCPQKGEYPFATHLGALRFMRSRDQKWSVSIQACSYCGNTVADKLGNIFHSVQFGEPTLDLLWVNHGPFLSTVLTRDQGDGTWWREQ